MNEAGVSPPLRMECAGRRGPLQEEGCCLCFRALSGDNVPESRRAGQTQPTEGTEEVGTSAFKHRLGSHLTCAARGRGAGCPPLSVSPGSHIKTSPIQQLPFASYRLSATGHVPKPVCTLMYSVPPICAHTQIHT